MICVEEQAKPLLPVLEEKPLVQLAPKAEKTSADRPSAKKTLESQDVASAYDAIEKAHQEMQKLLDELHQEKLDLDRLSKAVNDVSVRRARRA